MPIGKTGAWQKHVKIGIIILTTWKILLASSKQLTIKFHAKYEITAISSLVRRTMDPDHLLHDRLQFTPTTQQRELKSRHPFVSAASEQLKCLDKFNSTAAFWADHKWNTQWSKNTSRLHTFIPSSGPLPPEMTLPWPSSVKLNRLRTGVGGSAQQCTNGAWCPRRTADAEQRSKRPITY